MNKDRLSELERKVNGLYDYVASINATLIKLLKTNVTVISYKNIEPIIFIPVNLKENLYGVYVWDKFPEPNITINKIKSNILDPDFLFSLHQYARLCDVDTRRHPTIYNTDTVGDLLIDAYSYYRVSNPIIVELRPSLFIFPNKEYIMIHFLKQRLFYDKKKMFIREVDIPTLSQVVEHVKTVS